MPGKKRSFPSDNHSILEYCEKKSKIEKNEYIYLHPDYTSNSKYIFYFKATQENVKKSYLCDEYLINITEKKIEVHQKFHNDKELDDITINRVEIREDGNLKLAWYCEGLNNLNILKENSNKIDYNILFNEYFTEYTLGKKYITKNTRFEKHEVYIIEFNPLEEKEENNDEYIKSRKYKLYKIGFSRNFEDRLKNFKIHNPKPIRRFESNYISSHDSKYSKSLMEKYFQTILRAWKFESPTRIELFRVHEGNSKNFVEKIDKLYEVWNELIEPKINLKSCNNK